MKKLIALIMAVALVLSLSACFMPNANNNSSTEDQAEAADVSSYDKDFDGLVQYIKDRNSGCTEQELYYDIVGADNGTCLILNKNSFVEIYDFTSCIEGDSTADSAASPESQAKAQAVLADIRERDKFRPVEDGIELTAVITDSGKYVIAWDATRGYDYDKKVATDELKENW